MASLTERLTKCQVDLRRMTKCKADLRCLYQGDPSDLSAERSSENLNTLCISCFASQRSFLQKTNQKCLICHKLKLQAWMEYLLSVFWDNHKILQEDYHYEVGEVLHAYHWIWSQLISSVLVVVSLLGLTCVSLCIPCRSSYLLV